MNGFDSVFGVGMSPTSSPQKVLVNKRLNKMRETVLKLQVQVDYLKLSNIRQKRQMVKLLIKSLDEQMDSIFDFEEEDG
jgi:hypothetical protein